MKSNSNFHSESTAFAKVTNDFKRDLQLKFFGVESIDDIYEIVYQSLVCHNILRTSEVGS